MKRVVKCAACDGTGEWISPAVMKTDRTWMREAIHKCVTCGGARTLTYDDFIEPKPEALTEATAS